MRAPCKNELIILRYLINKAKINCDSDSLFVESMNDGGMGSLRIHINGIKKESTFGYNAAECWFHDTDGIPVTAAIFMDKNDILFELDMWKVDYSALNRWPQEGEISDDPLLEILQ